MSTATVPRPAVRPAPPPSNSVKPAVQPGTPRTAFSVSSGVTRKSHSVVLYGTGGIGKSSLAASIARVGLNAKFLDMEGGTKDLDVQRVGPITDWASLLSALREPSLWGPDDVVVLDSATKAQEHCFAHVVANVPMESGKSAKNIEDYGYGKGYRFVQDEFTNLLAALDRHIEAGRSVIMIAHVARANVPNPQGPDYIRFEPDLYHSTTGKSSVRDRVVQWCDHLCFINYDLAVKDDGVAVGAGSRAIYCQEQATFVAKSRTIEGPFKFFRGSADLWAAIFGREVIQ